MPKTSAYGCWHAHFFRLLSIDSQLVSRKGRVEVVVMVVVGGGYRGYSRFVGFAKESLFPRNGGDKDTQHSYKQTHGQFSLPKHSAHIL